MEYILLQIYIFPFQAQNFPTTHPCEQQKHHIPLIHQFQFVQRQQNVPQFVQIQCLPYGYDDALGAWGYVDMEESPLDEHYRDYLIGSSYDADAEYSDFADSEYGQESSQSDSDWDDSDWDDDDWSSVDDWDSSYTDWDSDW